MKKFSLIFLIVLLLSSCNFIENNTAEKIIKYDYESNGNIEIVKQTNQISYTNIEIYANYNDFHKDELEQILSNQEKIYIFYDLNLENNLGNLEILKNHVVIYYFINNFPYISTLYSETTNTKELKIEIIDFINDTLTKINNTKNTNKSLLSSSSNSNIFSPLYAGSFNYIKKPYGYISCEYNVSKYRANDISSLYLIESQMFFTPGSVAIINNESGYNNYLNSLGFVHLKALTAEDDMGYNQIRYGGTPIRKDSYPVNSPGQITISSSYSSGENLGYSFTNGFSIDNFTIENNNSYGLNINYSYNKSYTNTEPSLSAQPLSSDINKFSWIYMYNIPRIETFNLSFGYLFEMNNSGHQLREGDLAFRYDFKMEVININTSSTYSFTWWRYFGYF